MGAETSETLRHLRSHFCVVGLGWGRGKEFYFCFLAFPWLDNSMQITFMIKDKNLKSFITTGNLRARGNLSTQA